MTLNNLSFALFITLVSYLCRYRVITEKSVLTNQFALRIQGGEEVANAVAREHGFMNMGKVGSLTDVYYFKRRVLHRRTRDVDVDEYGLNRDFRVIWVEQQKVLRRVKRVFKPTFSDPRWKDQWYLQRTDRGYEGQDMNVLPAWERGITGKNVVVSILDDGIEYTHPELRKNYDRNASYDYNGLDADPFPRWTRNNENKHGTRCAAQVAATFNNSLCIVGVAYNARIGGIRMLDGEVTDLIEARSLSHASQYIHIYSSSWGPDDNGATVDGPGKLTRLVLEQGVRKGRNGKGNIFVWASGNGGRQQDNCNCDGYLNSIYTISVGAATAAGRKPYYGESCASTIISTYCSGSYSKGIGKIVTADLHRACTSRHTGTSAAAPFIAGFVALALEMNPKLTWRDVQHLLVETANMKHLIADDIKKNGVGRKVSHHFGYGLVDGGALVKLAAKWSLVSKQHICKLPKSKTAQLLNASKTLQIRINTTGCLGSSRVIKYLEHVRIVVTLLHSKRGALSIHLTSPMGTSSTILGRRGFDLNRGSFEQFAFMSTHYWGENPIGVWTLQFYSYLGNGFLDKQQIFLYGTQFKPGEPIPHEIVKPTPEKEIIKCHIECLDGCTGVEPHHCKKCKNYVINNQNKTCVSECPAAYYAIDNLKECSPCHSGCSTCFGPNLTDCTSCQSSNALFSGTCRARCPFGMYKVPLKKGYVCRDCDLHCAECSRSTDNCTQCFHGYVLIRHHCVAKCRHEEYLQTDTCKPCDAPCHTCSAPGSQNCTSCQRNGLHGQDVRTMYLHDAQCLFRCPLGYYEESLTAICEPCAQNCLKCDGTSHKCHVCAQGYFKSYPDHDECIKGCPTGQYAELNLGECKTCSVDCKTCKPGSPKDCTSCKPRMYLKGGQCIFATECGFGYFPNHSASLCGMCPFPCASCNSLGQCTSCVLNYFMDKDDNCLARCPMGTYIQSEGLSRKCMTCNDECQKCFGPSSGQCLQCRSGRYLYANKCIRKCPSDGYYTDHLERRCKPCHPACSYCTGPTQNECRGCVRNLDLRGTKCHLPCLDKYLAENSCEHCHSSCQTCVGPKLTDCLSCNENYTLHPYSSICGKSCPNGYYHNKSDGFCKMCYPSCKTCSGPGAKDCTSCKTILRLLKGGCLQQCPNGYFKHAGKCIPCKETCADCVIDPTICTACKYGYVRNAKEYKCIKTCGLGYYLVEDSTKCYPCHHSCKTCNGMAANQCTSCNNGSILYDSMCFATCPALYYANAPTTICSCPDNCLKCQERKKCEICRPPFILHNGTCVSSCPSNKYFQNLITNRCELCHPACSQCYGPNKWDCTECRRNYDLIDGSCVMHCGAINYTNDILGECQPCHNTCRSCIGPTERNCTSCGNGTYHDSESNTCVSKCADGYYGRDATCYPCHQLCQTCGVSKEDNCLSCYKPYFLFNSTCIKNCPSNMYITKIGNFTVCRPCSSVCVTCLGPSDTNCTNCKPALFLQNGRCLSECSEEFLADYATEKCILLEDLLKPTLRSLKSIKSSHSDQDVQEESTSLESFLVVAILLLISLIIIAAFLIYLRIRSRSNRINPYSQPIDLDSSKDAEWTDQDRKMSIR